MTDKQKLVCFLFIFSAVLSFVYCAVTEEPEKEPEPVEVVDQIVEVAPLEKIVAEEIVFYDVPLDEDLQGEIFAIADAFEIDRALVISIIAVESSFRPGAIGDDGDSVGLMQIQEKWHKSKMEELGVDDLLDPIGNVKVGCYILRGIYNNGLSDQETLAIYNSGSAKSKSGLKYADRVLKYRESLIEKA